MLPVNTLLQRRYRIIRLIKSGGMGEVYEALDQHTTARVAVKRLSVPQPTPTVLRAFEREAAVLANLRHPNLPWVGDHFHEQQSQFLVMEFVPGDDFEEMLSQRGLPFPAADVMRWADQLLDTLDFLHTHTPPIFHRDIKPQNLKLTARGQIVLLDFGLAKSSLIDAQPASMMTSMIGYTPGYAPLEQMQGSGVSARSDLYAAGATLYHLLTMAAPADALSRAAALIQGRADPLQPAHTLNADVPIELSRLLSTMLALDFNRRPSSAAAVRSGLGLAAAAAPQRSGAVTPGAPTGHAAYSGQTLLAPAATVRVNFPAVSSVPASLPAALPNAQWTSTWKALWLILFCLAAVVGCVLVSSMP